MPQIPREAIRQCKLLFNNNWFHNLTSFFRSCKNVPTALLDKNALKCHFLKFGTVLRVILRPKSKSCIVEYETKDSARQAYLYAGNYHGDLFSVNWSKKVSPRKKHVKKDPDPDYIPDPDIEGELSAMAGTKDYNLRPEGKTF